MTIDRRGTLVGLAASAALGGCATTATTPQSFRDRKKFQRLGDGLRMAYYEIGRGAPIVFLHGNPTSSYLWRNVIPHVAMKGRCIAPDLMGMGDSDKLPEPGPGTYTFEEHARRLDEFLRRLGLNQNVTLVLHDWGGPLGFYWAARNPDAVRAIGFMETFVVSMTSENTPQSALDFFLRFRSPQAEVDVLEQNHFVENVLLRQFPDMSAEDQAEYRRPFLTPGVSRWPTLEWPRQAPINGEPAPVHAALQQGLEFMASTPKPKLFVRSDPGALISRGRENVCRAWPSVTERVVPGRHYIQEESPAELGAHLSEWLTVVGG